jgi:hypothetical protein
MGKGLQELSFCGLCNDAFCAGQHDSILSGQSAKVLPVRVNASTELQPFLSAISSVAYDLSLQAE